MSDEEDIWGSKVNDAWTTGICESVANALAALNGAAARLATANNYQWAERESQFIFAYFDLQGAMAPFLEKQGQILKDPGPPDPLAG